MIAPRKRRIEEITTLSEPIFSEAQARHFQEGIDEFNRGDYHSAHESWEEAWREMDSDAEIFLRGLVQFAAAHHCLSTLRLECAARNFKKAHEKLRLAPPRFMGFNVATMLRFIEQFQATSDTSLRYKLHLQP
ncbi:MAG: hypothetical protein HY22_11320 [[Candidatus Thermochlorobacteriaceae] bacterium GBChlB]|nr:MAG: hypothetical protein HY22_11320 [[Candidatus Thermochlorobacteriaceae] bacterium GBChlB]